jgi:outer membrane protein TolC
MDLAQKRLDNGYGDYLSELAAAMVYQQAVLTEVQARAMRLGDSAALYQALGGGWWNRKTGPLTGQSTEGAAAVSRAAVTTAPN